LIKFETSTSGYYCLLFLPWPKCFHSFFFSDPGDLPFFLGRKSSDSSSESLSPPPPPPRPRPPSPNYLLVKNHFINPLTITFEMAKWSQKNYFL
jgi:hypothetical protein